MLNQRPNRDPVLSTERTYTHTIYATTHTILHTNTSTFHALTYIIFLNLFSLTKAY